MISLENMAGGSGTRTIQLTGLRPQAGLQAQRPIQVPSAVGQGPRSVAVPGVSGVRVLTAAGNRLSRPVLFTSSKSLHNIILQVCLLGGCFSLCCVAERRKTIP